MHEFSVAQEILRIVGQEQYRHGFASVAAIRLKAGALSGIDGACLRYAFEVVREGTCAAGAELEMEVEALRVVCRTCGHAMDGSHGPRACGRCGGTDLRIDGSSGFEIVSLEVDT